MKRLMTLMMVVVVMAVSVGVVEAQHPTLRNPQGYGGYYGGYGGYGSYGSYGGYYGDSDAGKMLAVGHLVRDLASAATSLKSTWGAWELARRDQEYRNQRRTQPVQVVYPTPSVNQRTIAENTNLLRKNQMLREKIEQEKAKEVLELKQKNEALEQKLKDAGKISQEKIQQAPPQQTSSENQELQKKIEELEKKRKELEERQRLQGILDALMKDIQDLEDLADPS